MYIQVFKKNKEFNFILFFLVIEILLEIIFSYSQMGGFSLTPYIRIILITVTFGFFLIDILNVKIPIKSNSLVFSYNGLFVYGWLIFAIISIFLGLLNKNPILYILTDFIYVFFGALLFLITEQRKSNHTLPAFFWVYISRIFAGFALVCLIFDLKSPSLLLVVMVALIYLNIIKKRGLEFSLLLIPYLLLVVTTNRTQLVVFFLMFLILFLNKSRHYFSKKVVLLFGLGMFFILFFLKHQILDFMLFFVNPKSNIGFRIQQLSIILNEGIDYSSSFMVSISQRVVEAKMVFHYWIDNSINFIFGLGSGATIDGGKFFIDGSVLNSSLLGSNRVHNIHLLPFSLIFRYGFIGLLLFCILLYIVFKSLVKVLNEKEDSSVIFWNLFFILWFIFSIPAASFLWSMPVFWISFSMIKNKKLTKPKN